MSETEPNLPHLFQDSVTAGFPAPVHGSSSSQLDIHQYLVSHPHATFFVRVAGDSMIQAGIHPGDILVVDRSLSVKNRDIVIAQLDNEFTVKRIIISDNSFELHPENPKYPIIHCEQHQMNQIFGVVSGSFRKYGSS